MTTKKEPKTYIITEEVFTQIRETVGYHIPETGGILGSSDGKHIDHFYFDRTAEVTGATYEPDCVELNLVIQKWYEEGIEFVGFIHSHPRGAVKPSDPDNLYTTASDSRRCLSKLSSRRIISQNFKNRNFAS